MNVTQTSSQKAFDANQSNEKHCQEWLNILQKQIQKPVQLATLAGSLNGLLMIGQAALLSIILQLIIIEKHRWLDLPAYILALLAVFVLRSICVFYFQKSGFSASTQIKQKVRQQLMTKIYTLGPRYIKYQHTGQLAATTLEQCEAMDNYYCRYLPQKHISLIVPVLILLAVFPVNWIVGLIFLVTGPLVPVFMALIGMGAAAASRNQFLEIERMGAYFLDRLQGITTLKLFGHAEHELSQIQQVADSFREKTMKVLGIAFLSSAVLEFFSAVAVALVAVYVGLGLLGLIQFGPASDITLQEALFVLLLAPEFFIPLRQLAVNYHDRAAALAAANRILKILEEPVNSVQTDLRCDSEYCIEFHKVCLEYQQKKILNSINLQIRSGEKIALTGETGSGKTSLLNLILGFEQATKGKVLMGGRSEISESVTKHIAWAGQKAAIFYGSIAENIGLFNPAVSMEEITRAADAAGVTEFSELLAEGLQTTIGEQGYGLSGGQIQRIALARVFLKNADIILLDEPTAHLDHETKSKVMDAIDHLFRNKTVIIASHDPVVIKRMDRRLHLEQGRLL